MARTRKTTRKGTDRKVPRIPTGFTSGEQFRNYIKTHGRKQLLKNAINYSKQENKVPKIRRSKRLAQKQAKLNNIVND